MKDPNVFDGKWFLVFAALDKGSGIDHYEVMETNHVVNTVENGVIEISGSRGIDPGLVTTLCFVMSSPQT